MTTTRLSTTLIFLTFLSVHGVAAQTAAPVPAEDPSSSSVPLKPAADEQTPTLRPPAGSLFKSIGHDVTNFFSLDTAKIMVPFTIAGIAASHWDHAAVEDAEEHIPSSAYSIGNFGGSLYAQLGA